MIKIGMIGMSQGNAHPYSWCSIINGHFNGEEISRVGYPAVASYLNANRETLGISEAEVTHVWTQDEAISISISRHAKITSVVDKLEDMVSEVDAVILARDDSENHVEMAKHFIDASIPIFIDKPIAGNTVDLDYFVNQASSGKLIMSCSSLRYSSECLAAKAELSSLGNLVLVTAVGKKDWLKYGVHILEGIFMLLDDPKVVSVTNVGENGENLVNIKFENGLRASVHIFQEIVPTLQISLFGKKGWRLIEIKNSYAMFRSNIIEFIRSVQEGRSRVHISKTENIIRTLLAANNEI